MAKSKKRSKIMNRKGSKTKKSMAKSLAGRRFATMAQLRAATPKPEIVVVEAGPFTTMSQASPNRYVAVMDEEPIDFGEFEPMVPSNYRYSPNSFMMMGGRKSRY